MFLFYRLLLAHFLSEALFEPRVKNSLKIALRAVTFGLLSLLFSFTYLENIGVIGFIVIVAIFYYFINLFKSILCAIKGREDNLWFYLAEQCITIFLLAGTIYLPYTAVPRYTLTPVIHLLYNNTPALIAVILIISAASAGGVFLFYLKQLLTYENSPFQRDWQGRLERGVITLLVILGNWWLILIPAVILGKIYTYFKSLGNLKNWLQILNRAEPGLEFQKLKLKENLIIDLALSPALAILAGIMYYLLN